MAGTELASAYVTLFPKLKTDGVEAQLRGIKADGAGESAGTSFGNGFGSTLKSTAIRAAAVAGTAAAAALVTTMNKSLRAYADYEQLVGGVETLFKDSADQIQMYASEAYRTAGISANEYMEQATSFSASLIQSLGGDTAAAAEYANRAILDMSDNANKMGSDIEMIQNAYQGFAKQNFTMLDNLKLGYGGTQEEMKRLLADAEAIMAKNGEIVEYSIDSYADIVDAVHVVQTEMGITGTTALEASETISGSVSAMKAQWENWLVAIADGNADVVAETEELASTIATAIGNIVPVVGQVLVSILYLIYAKLGDMLTAGIELIKNFALGIVDGFPFVISEIGRGIQEGIDKIRGFWESFKDAGRYLISGLTSGISAGKGSATGAMGDVASSVVARAKNAWIVRSPSRVFMEIGQYAVEGLTLGITNRASGAVSAMGAVAESVLDAASFSTSMSPAYASAGAGGSATYITLNCDIKDLQGIQTLNDLYDVLARARAINPTRR